jgi:IS5 family transposase
MRHSSYQKLGSVDKHPAMLADKGYDSDAIRQDLRDRGTAPEIATKRNRKVQHSANKPLYKMGAPIECFIGHLKE